MWGSVSTDEIRQIRQNRLRTRRDALFADIYTLRKAYAKTITEQEFIRDQLRLAQEHYNQAVYAYQAGSPDEARQVERIAEAQGEVEHWEQRQAAVQERQDRLGAVLGPALKAQGKVSGVPTRRASLQKLWNAPNRAAQRLSGGSAGLFFGLLGVILLLYLALVAAPGHQSSRLILAQKALAGQEVVASG